MKILLVNSNPVVSRLTALSARKEGVELDEIKNISELKNKNYNIVFVDSESYSDEVSTTLKNSNIDKKVLFYTQNDGEPADLFNFDILKPFLPSEVSAILRETKIELEDRDQDSTKQHKEEKVEEENIKLEELIAEKTDDLEPLNLMEDKPKKPQEEFEIKPPVTKHKEEIKDSFDLELELDDMPQLTEIKTEKVIEKTTIAKTAIDKEEEIENSFDLELEKSFPLNLNNEIPPKIERSEKDKIELTTETEEDLLSELNSLKSSMEDKKDHFDLSLGGENDLFELDSSGTKDTNLDSDLFTLDEDKSNLTQNKKMEEDLLDLDLDSKNEIDFDAPKIVKSRDKKTKDKIEEKKESKPIETATKIKKDTKAKIDTKILDKDEISNIKNLLNENIISDDNLSLDDVMTTSAPVIATTPPEEESKTKKKKKKLKKEKEEIQEQKEQILETKRGVESKGNLSGDVLSNTLSALPIEDLRKLLRGAKVSIVIEFPNEI